MNFRGRKYAVSGLMLACWLASAPLLLAQSTIAYFCPAQPLQGLQGLQLDMNGDGQAEVRFYDASQGVLYFATHASGKASARLLVTPRGPYDIGSYLAGLPEAFQVGSSTNGSLFWSSSDAPNNYGDAAVLGTFISQEAGIIPAGYFYGTTAYAGIQFQIGSAWHYGWVRIRGGTYEDAFAPPGWILDWAYETRPNTPIRAGAKPVPVPMAAPQMVRAGKLRLTWLTEIGKPYQIQCKENLIAPLWTNLNFSVVGTATNASVDVPIVGTTKFFRVVEAE